MITLLDGCRDDDYTQKYKDIVMNNFSGSHLEIYSKVFKVLQDDINDELLEIIKRYPEEAITLDNVDNLIKFITNDKSNQYFIELYQYMTQNGH